MVLNNIKTIKPCPCGSNRWKTRNKGQLWFCRNCGIGRRKQPIE